MLGMSLEFFKYSDHRWSSIFCTTLSNNVVFMSHLFKETTGRLHTTPETRFSDFVH